MLMLLPMQYLIVCICINEKIDFSYHMNPIVLCGVPVLDFSIFQVFGRVQFAPAHHMGSNNYY